MYFLGKPDVLKVKGNPHLVRTNSGYDDERGDYNVVAKDHIAYRWVWGPVGGREDATHVSHGGGHACTSLEAHRSDTPMVGDRVWLLTLPPFTPFLSAVAAACRLVPQPCRYEVLGILGKGSFGQVLKVLDYKTGSFKALKIIRNKKRFHHQAQVELKVLEHLRSNDGDDSHNVIHIQEHFMFRNHLCITFELLSINLYEFIKQNNFVGLSISLIRRFAVQMLQSLA